jgi:hypothetical protein
MCAKSYRMGSFGMLKAGVYLWREFKSKGQENFVSGCHVGMEALQNGAD